MLKITVPAREYFDDNTQMFINIPEQKLELEHSLFSLSKWEAKWGKAFLGKQTKTNEELFDYIRCMTITPDVNPMVYSGLTQENQKQIEEYINSKMSATCLPERKGGRSGDTPTSELIYYWMVSLQIPFECQHWHLNRLLTLIQVCNIKNQPSKKMNRGDLMRRNSALNAQRRAKHHTKG